MSTATLLLQRSSAAVRKAEVRTAAEARHPKMLLLGHLGTRVVVPFAPAEVTRSGLPGSRWDTVSRGIGRKPLLLPGEDELRTLAFQLDVVYPARGVSIEPVLAGVARLQQRREVVTLSYGPAERGAWRITAGTFQVTERQHGTNAATRATVAITLTEVSDAPKVALRRPPAPPPKKKPTPKPERVHVFRKGQTCWELAERYYGDPYKWPVIAKRNKIKNVRRIPIGFRAVIPNL